MAEASTRIGVVGGGLAGLSAAYQLRRQGASVTLFEASDRLGGVVATEHHHGFIMERGPDVFLAKPDILRFVRELGLEQELVAVQPGLGRSLIVRGGRLLPVPEGLHLMAPGALLPFARSSLVSWPGKARMLLDLVLPRRTTPDETLASFVRRRLGQEALDRLAQPLIGGIYGADPERLGLAATMPQFQAMERTFGSVIRGLMARRETAAGANYGAFRSFRLGMGRLVEALSERVGEVHLSHYVAQVQQPVAGQEGASWRVTTAAGQTFAFDAVCLALPLPAVARLLPALPIPPLAYSSMATINLGFPRQAIGHHLRAAGFVVPAIEGRQLVACTFSSQKFAGRAPDGAVLLRAFAGGMLGADAYALGDDHLVAAVLCELRDLLRIDGQPHEVLVSRCPESMPQYEPGHILAVKRLMEALPKGLALAGNAYQGVGLPDCVASGIAAAERLARAGGSRHPG